MHPHAPARTRAHTTAHVLKGGGVISDPFELQRVLCALGNTYYQVRVAAPHMIHARA